MEGIQKEMEISKTESGQFRIEIVYPFSVTVN